MLISKSRYLSNKFNNSKLLPLLAKYSTQPALKDKEDEFDKQLKEFDRLSKITKKDKVKKPQKPPFAKNLFLGKFDTEILTYPQISNEELNLVNSKIEDVSNVINQFKNDDVSVLSKDFLMNLANKQCIGLQAPQLLGGSEASITEVNRHVEVFGAHRLHQNIVHNELLGLSVLNRFGSDFQKKEYLELLISGQALSAFCLAETKCVDVRYLNTKATYSEKEKKWYLNGDKAFVVNGDSADILIVFAQTDLDPVTKEGMLTGFVVRKDFGGITSKRCQTLNDNQFEICHLNFNNTPVPEENVIGKVDEGKIILSKIIPEFRLSAGPIGLSLCKETLNKLTAHFVDASTDVIEFHKSDAVTTKIAQIIVHTYALESVIYLTSGLLDEYENQDCDLEASIVKVLAAQLPHASSAIAVDLIGSPCLEPNHWCNQLHRRTFTNMLLDENVDNLKIVIALLGLQHAGAEISDKIKKLRNPLFNGPMILKHMWTRRRQVEDRPKLNLHLGDYLHPSCIRPAEQLEYCVLRLQFATEILLSKHGLEVINQHADLRRLAECIIDVYAMTACLSRASRSYCIGLRHSDMEMVIANTFCINALERVKKNVNDIFSGYYFTCDQNYRLLSKKLFKFKGYFPEHPLTRNF